MKKTRKPKLLNCLPVFLHFQSVAKLLLTCLAIESKVDYIVTRDHDLLDLMTGYDLESKTFRQKTRPLKIIVPLEFLKIVEEEIKKAEPIKS